MLVEARHCVQDAFLFMGSKLLFFCQLLDLIKGDFFCGTEVGASHITDKAAQQLAGCRTVVEVGEEVGSADEQFPFAHAYLEEQRKGACREPVVDDADDGLDVWREEVVAYGIAVGHGIMPLVVAVPLGGKPSQRRMAGVA